MTDKTVIFKKKILAFFVVFIFSSMMGAFAGDIPDRWKSEWSATDFSKSSIEFSEVMSGGPPKDGIPAIDDPKFKPVSDINDIGDKEPVISIEIDGKAKAYPLRILMWHEIANDELSGVPITVTYCPLCNSSVIFDRRINNKILDFGVSGKLRHSDMIMYDRQTESWWQQFLGEGVVGEMTGVKLKRLPSRIIPFAKFKKSHPQGQVLIANNKSSRNYGSNPYFKYDSADKPFLLQKEYNGPIPSLAYVIAIDKKAWPLEDIRKQKRIVDGDIIIEWQTGMNSALDQQQIDKGQDIGYVTVQRKQPDGSLINIAYDMSFAFAFSIFQPDGKIIIHE